MKLLTYFAIKADGTTVQFVSHRASSATAGGSDVEHAHWTTTATNSDGARSCSSQQSQVTSVKKLTAASKQLTDCVIIIGSRAAAAATARTNAVAIVMSRISECSPLKIPRYWPWGRYRVIGHDHKMWLD